MNECIKCGDLGIPGGCPRCGKDSNKVRDILTTKHEKEKFIKNCSYKLIEEEYIGVDWDSTTLINSHPELEKDNLFIKFVMSLEKMHDLYAKGTIPRKSVFIYAPAKFSKCILAYSIMQHCISNNIEVAPFLDTIDVKRLLTLGADNPNYKYLGFSYDRYINSTVCIVSVTKLEKYTESLPVIQELISKRSRLGLPTIVLSRYNLEQISSDALDSDWTSLVETSSTANRLKYPVILSYNPIKESNSFRR